MIQDQHGIVHEEAGDEVLCGPQWYDGERLRVWPGWRSPASRVVTCFFCWIRRLKWLD